MSRVEQFERIRRDYRLERLSIRELARRHRVHRRTVRQALMSAIPPARKVPERESPVVGPELRKGQPVKVAGRLDQREWTTGDGTHRQTHQIIARTVDRLDQSWDPVA